jgi:cell wall-associated NlpC family hydrolase
MMNGANAMDPKQIESLVKKYSGIPYKHAGRDLTGLDCLGLLHFFYKDCGIWIPDGDGCEYSKDWTKTDPERYLRGIMAIGTAAPVDDLQPLDLAYFRMGRNVTHGAVMIDSEHFLHVLQNTRVHVSRMDPVWRRRLYGARRVLI